VSLHKGRSRCSFHRLFRRSFRRSFRCSFAQFRGFWTLVFLAFFFGRLCDMAACVRFRVVTFTFSEFSGSWVSTNLRRK
jgi:hypothetical protein